MRIPQIDSDTIILTFTDKVYLPIFNIWYRYFETLHLPNLLVVSLDDTTYNDLIARNIRTILCKYTIDVKKNFWEFRLNTIFDIFKSSQKNLIHTDADCIWLKDVYNLIHDMPDDFIGSIEYGHPRSLSERYGFVMCCGFYYIKYNDRMMRLLKTIMSQVKSGTDDQVLFNTYMFANKESIVSDPTELISKVIRLNDGTQIVLLKDSIIKRGRADANIYCCHPWLSATSTILKIDEMRAKMGDQAEF